MMDRYSGADPGFSNRGGANALCTQRSRAFRARSLTTDVQGPLKSKAWKL